MFVWVTDFGYMQPEVARLALLVSCHTSPSWLWSVRNSAGLTSAPESFSLSSSLDCVVIGIAEIIQFDYCILVGRQIDFILWPTVKIVAKLATIIKPVALLLCPLLEFYQLDWAASRCSRKSFNLLKDSLRESGRYSFMSFYTFICPLAYLFL